jgi:hypothetical protein
VERSGFSNGGTISASKVKRFFSCLTSDGHSARYELERDKKAPLHRRGLLFGGLEGGRTLSKYIETFERSKTPVGLGQRGGTRAAGVLSGQLGGHSLTICLRGL